jgi:2-amino-4-hydroxy-6-hydroxymethyldihydropteridine diphosphokinase
MFNSAFIGLGSNLNNPVQQLIDAIQQLKRMTGSSIEATSSFYKTPPMGPQDQPHYINAAVKLETSLKSHELLNSLQAIETLQKRNRETERWGARTIDLDILLYNNEISDDPVLTIPHPGIALRSFVLYPLLELDENLTIPTLGKVNHLIHQLGEPAPTKISSEHLEK